MKLNFLYPITTLRDCNIANRTASGEINRLRLSHSYSNVTKMAYEAIVSPFKNVSVYSWVVLRSLKTNNWSIQHPYLARLDAFIKFTNFRTHSICYNRYFIEAPGSFGTLKLSYRDMRYTLNYLYIFSRWSLFQAIQNARISHIFFLDWML